MCIRDRDFVVGTAFLFELHLQFVQPDCWQIKQVFKGVYELFNKKPEKISDTTTGLDYEWSPFRLSRVGWFSRALAFLRSTPVPEGKWQLLVVYCWFPCVESTKGRAQTRYSSQAYELKVFLVHSFRRRRLTWPEPLLMRWQCGRRRILGRKLAFSNVLP